MSKVKCEICSKTFKMISNTHLKSHGLNVEQYKEKFPEAELVSSEVKNRLANNGSKTKGRKHSDEVKKKISKARKGSNAWNKGLESSEETKKKISDSMTSKYQSGEIVHWNTGNTMDNDTKTKISESLSNRNLSEDHKQKLSDSQKARYKLYGSPLKGKPLSEDHKKKSILGLQKANENRRLKSEYEIRRIALSENLSIDSIEDHWVNLTCNKCKTRFSYTKQIFRPSKKFGKHLCPSCHPKDIGRRKKEMELFEFIQSIEPNAIPNDRQSLYGKEIDIFIPYTNIGFEFTGLFWHSELGAGLPKNHLLWKKQYAHNNGIKLYTIFEDEWDEKKSIVKSRIKHILGKNPTLCYARHCEIKQISNSAKNDFLIENHIQGKDISGIRYGSFYKDKLVAVMTFSKTNISKGGDGTIFELNRFAVLKNINIPGVSSKMLTRFLREYNPETIISYADQRWSNGNVYESLGFEYASTSPPSYWYLEKYNNRLHRSVFMKHRVIKMGGDPNKTEWENMQDFGYDRIWDCGTTKWILKNKGS